MGVSGGNAHSSCSAAWRPLRTCPWPCPGPQATEDLLPQGVNVWTSHQLFCPEGHTRMHCLHPEVRGEDGHTGHCRPVPGTFASASAPSPAGSAPCGGTAMLPRGQRRGRRGATPRSSRRTDLPAGRAMEAGALQVETGCGLQGAPPAPRPPDPTNPPGACEQPHESRRPPSPSPSPCASLSDE